MSENTNRSAWPCALALVISIASAAYVFRSSLSGLGDYSSVIFLVLLVLSGIALIALFIAHAVVNIRFYGPVVLFAVFAFGAILMAKHLYSTYDEILQARAVQTE